MREQGKLPIAEIFGPTIQGEGFSQGHCCSFLRLQGCNLDCSWCDTPFTWDPEGNCTWSHWASLLCQIREQKTSRVVITGGEPMIHQRSEALGQLIGGLVSRGVIVEIETNGTITPSQVWAGLVRFNVSPKLMNSGVPQARRIRAKALDWFRNYPGATFKFVIERLGDFQEIDDLLGRYPVPDDRVWIMPQGITAGGVAQLTRDIAQEAINRRWNITPRLQVLIWGNERRR